jgi:hypothetical protein
MKNTASNEKRQRTVKVRVAVLVDADGNWSAAGWKGAGDNEAMDVARDADCLEGTMQEYFVTVEVPLPRRIELTASTVENGTLIEAEDEKVAA